MLFNIYFIASASAYDCDMQAHAFLATCDSDQSRKKTSLVVNGENIKHDVDGTDDKDWKLSLDITFLFSFLFQFHFSSIELSFVVYFQFCF